MTTTRKPRRTATPRTARAILDGQVSESQLQRDVLALAARLGWLGNHTYDSRKSGPDKGFPDLILAKDLAKTGGAPRVIAIELKTERGRVSAAQWDWQVALLGPLECYVWRPRHWSSGEIERVLMGAPEKSEAA